MSEVTMPVASPVDNPEAPEPGQTEEQRLAQQVADLTKQNDELKKATEAQAATIATQQGVIAQYQTALEETSKHVATLVKAIGRLM